ncbi:DR2241 family protein [Natronobiforma cellulositropha]|uniref:DR2241 family protein n=1 Tax=Natronobiforma cellulositropha TaxID=1679076 RepID=UPI0021D5E0FC|nr:DR2241 family protein [Natronobiforma cellulositropha]
MSEETPATAVEALCERVERAGHVALDGLRVEKRADGYALETPAEGADGLDEEGLSAALAEVPAYVTNWHYWHRVGGVGTARRAFLRWCEHAPLEGDADNPGETLAPPSRYEALTDGLEREWGQLAITSRLAGETGERVYEVRHVDDAETAVGDLERLDGPRAARDLTTEDDRGRYRPLKTAPTLVSGWVLPHLSGSDLLETVEFVYPATVANWHRERGGDLDVDHWLETAHRQSGIYDVVDELPREAVEWMADACCVDSQCLRRREWHYEEDDHLSVPGGDGVFPCREPCSLVIAAARKWAILESEREQTWTVELTLSEKNQLEALLEAVADGRVDEIREADLNDGANRYRARYLRAKRAAEGSLFDETGDEDGA